MVYDEKLILILDDFIKGHDANWCHDDWLNLVDNVKKSGYELEENELGLILESEKSLYQKRQAKINELHKLTNRQSDEIWEQFSDFKFRNTDSTSKQLNKFY